MTAAAFLAQLAPEVDSDFAEWVRAGAPGSSVRVTRRLRRELERRGDPRASWDELAGRFAKLGARADKILTAGASAGFFAGYKSVTKWLLLGRRWLQFVTSDSPGSLPLTWLIVDEGQRLADDFERTVAEAERA